MTQQDNYWWALSGSGYFDLRSNSSGSNTLSAYAAYGHSAINVTIGFSIPGFGSIQFSPGMNTAATAYEDQNPS